jgi:hypothetical protein
LCAWGRKLREEKSKSTTNTVSTITDSPDLKEAVCDE